MVQGQEEPSGMEKSDRVGSRNVSVCDGALVFLYVSVYLLTAARDASIGDAEESRQYLPVQEVYRRESHEGIPSSAGGV